MNRNILPFERDDYDAPRYRRQDMPAWKVVRALGIVLLAVIGAYVLAVAFAIWLSETWGLWR